MGATQRLDLAVALPVGEPCTVTLTYDGRNVAATVDSAAGLAVDERAISISDPGVPSVFEVARRAPGAFSMRGTFHSAKLTWFDV